MIDRLTAFQREILDAFFREETGWFLTGGAALASYHLGHRETHDLDLFATDDRMDSAERSLERIAARIGARVVRTQTSPDFRRRTFERGNEAVVVDLVRERAPQLHDEKQRYGDVRVDPPDEILANKLCALLSRSEIRDIVDVMALERSGLDLRQGLRDAAIKDGGMTPAQLAYVLSQITIGDDAPVPMCSAAELRSYLANLIERLGTWSKP
jgi:predicted nucleotidyltransferase component of viral defense system